MYGELLAHYVSIFFVLFLFVGAALVYLAVWLGRALDYIGEQAEQIGKLKESNDSLVADFARFRADFARFRSDAFKDLNRVASKLEDKIGRFGTELSVDRVKYFQMRSTVEVHNLDLKERALEAHDMKGALESLSDRVEGIEKMIQTAHDASRLTGDDMHQLGRTLTEVTRKLDSAAGTCHAMGSRLQGDEGNDAEDAAYTDFAVS